MGDSGRWVPEEAVLSIFTAGRDPHEPRSTGEVATALDCAHRTAYEKLDRLVQRGRLASKKVGGNTRIWWLPTETGSRQGEDEFSLPNLTADQVLNVEFRSVELGQAFRAISPDIEMELDGIVELADGSVLQYLTISGANPRGVMDALRQFPHIIDLRLFNKRGDEFRIEGHSTGESMGKLFREFGGTTKTAYIEDDAFVIVGEVPPKSDVSLLTEVAATYYPDIELTNVELSITPRLFRSVVQDELTERQWMSLTTGYYGGYFERPRASTSDELADRLDITRQTFHHHLRNVQRTVFRTLLEGFSDIGRTPHSAGTTVSDQ
ncbi:bacterio-opsin activator domain-containing protein [Haloarchaeobius sp. DT45]|uniref:helix-turn-helix domain-containing protein n=1 Tax=Haloarchaeobius sp. DT45 TaxID=3446116 RepID=UPI003F6AE2E3